jgi:hypothetical protein
LKGNDEKPNPALKIGIEQKVINALRLFKAGKMTPISTITSSKTGYFIPKVSYTFERPNPFLMMNEFELFENEKKEFLELWKTYQKVNVSEKHFLSVAIRKFSQANEREGDEDRIIDYLISAEALFLSSGGSFQSRRVSGTMSQLDLQLHYNW